MKTTEQVRNQLLQFWNEEFMPEAFENQVGLSFGNMDSFVIGFENPQQAGFIVSK